MASNDTISPYYLLQNSFATGVISRDVANRIDLDKYQAAVLRADNCFIKPFGPLFKRPGTDYIGTTNDTLIRPKLVPFSSSDGDYLIVLGINDSDTRYIKVYYNTTLKTTITSGVPEWDVNKLKLCQSADTLFIASGDFPVYQLKHNTTADTWAFSKYVITKPYFDDSIIDASDSCTITPSAVSGTITLTASEDIFDDDMVDSSGSTSNCYIRLKQDVASSTVSKTFSYSEENPTYTSSSIYCGEGWKIISHNTWKGNFRIQYSDDNSNWKEYRKYTGNEDYNPTESGSFSEGKYIRFIITLSSGKITVDLTALSYVKTGYARITEVSDARTATAKVVERFGNTSPTKQWAASVWCPLYGYPRTVTFFQDRLCFGGNKIRPYVLWMSCTGDYNNFTVTTASGKVTDDSAVALSFISRKQYEIKHLIAHKDLLVFTSGNEWVLSGNEVITPSNATPRMQSTYGCSDVEPVVVGNKLIFIQENGHVVREFGYSYESDSYHGTDLTLLYGQEKTFIGMCYIHEPYDMLFFLDQDGTISVLSYITEQKVFAWSDFPTSGIFKSICCIRINNVDAVYCSVLRGAKGFIERFSEITDESIALDCSVSYIRLRSDRVDVSHLKSLGQKVTAYSKDDNKEYKDLTIGSDGYVTLPERVLNVVVGLPFKMTVELPRIEIKNRDGSMDGRYKTVSEVILKLYNSLGGFVGPDENNLDEIYYDEFQKVEDIPLFSGYKRMPVPIGGFNLDGKIVITDNSCYPFYLMSIVRVVSFGG